MMAAAANNRDPDENTLKFFYQSSLPPRLTRVEHEIEAQLLPEFERQPVTRKLFYLEFNLPAKLRGSFEEQAAVGATVVGGPVVSLNEWRARLNLPPMPGGDEVLVPLNSLRGGGPQASPQNPMETPARGIEPAGTTPGQASETVEDVLAKVEQSAAEYEAEIERAASLREIKARFEERHAEALRKFFARQRSLRVGVADKELADRLFAVQYQNILAIVGELPDETESLKDRADKTAAAINAATNAHLADGGSPDDVYGDLRAAEIGVELTASATEWADAHRAKVRT
jgi:hypothetical protein